LPAAGLRARVAPAAKDIAEPRKRPHKGGAAPKSGAAVAARLLRRNRPTEAVSRVPCSRGDF